MRSLLVNNLRVVCCWRGLDAEAGVVAGWFDDGTGFVVDGTGLVIIGAGFVDDGTNFVVDGACPGFVTDGSGLVDDRTGLVDDGTGLVKNGNGWVDDGTGTATILRGWGTQLGLGAHCEARSALSLVWSTPVHQKLAKAVMSSQQ